MRYCLESAGMILQILPDLSQVHMAGTDSKFYTFTPFACPIMLAGYTFLMLRHKAENYGPPTGIKAGKRSLLSECERGAASCMEVLDGFSQAWMHLEDAASKLMGFCLSRLPTSLHGRAANFWCRAYERKCQMSLVSTAVQSRLSC